MAAQSPPMSNDPLSVHKSTSLYSTELLKSYGIVIDPHHAEDDLIPSEILDAIRLEDGDYPATTSPTPRTIDEVIASVLPNTDKIRSLEESSLATVLRRALPSRRVPGSPDLPVPEPDYLYGYNAEAFELLDPHNTASSHSKVGLIRQMAKVDTSVYWPFFIVQSQHSDVHHIITIVRECAVTAAACLNAVQKLSHELTPGRAVEDLAAYTLHVFSLATLGHNALINIHYIGDNTYHTAKVERYDLNEQDQVVELKALIRGIIRWGLHHRLTSLRDALDSLNLDSLPDKIPSKDVEDHVTPGPIAAVEKSTPAPLNAKGGKSAPAASSAIHEKPAPAASSASAGKAGKSATDVLETATNVLEFQNALHEAWEHVGSSKTLTRFKDWMVTEKAPARGKVASRGGFSAGNNIRVGGRVKGEFSGRGPRR